jgi:hypothetical protein
MATPSTSGSALLVRNYFSTSDTDFWVGLCNPAYRYCKAFVPSGLLVKAVLINSGSAMVLYHGGGPADIPLGPPPDAMQGFGRITFANTLPLKGVYQSTDLYVDDMRIIAPFATNSYTVSVSSNSAPFRYTFIAFWNVHTVISWYSSRYRATLVWYDAPSVGGSTTPALVHDLDLVVTSPSGKK